MRAHGQACGDGHYTRWFKEEKGAARVLGVDVSEAMIKLAEEHEVGKPLGIEYLCQDAATLEARKGYSLVFAGFLLNYAANYEELLRFAKAIHRLLPSGGVFLTVQDNPHDGVTNHPELAK